MTNYLELPLGEKAPNLVTIVVEIPQDSVNKYEYDKTLQLFRLDRNLYSPVHYPGDYGFIPQTLAKDGDPLDILVLGDAPSFPGCVLTARPVGLFKMLDQGVEDEKILAYANGNPTFSHIESYKSCYPQILREVEHFFSIYKDLEGKRTQVVGWGDADEAREMIVECHERYLAATQDKETK
ncbi:MAG: inorganic diphosphatase [Acidobacteriaceae bacterium]